MQKDLHQITREKLRHYETGNKVSGVRAPSCGAISRSGGCSYVVCL